MDGEGVGIEMDVDSYLTSLVDQLSNIPITFTKGALLLKLKEAHEIVVIEMKQTTKYVT
jgi:hypothetical protein